MSPTSPTNVWLYREIYFITISNIVYKERTYITNISLILVLGMDNTLII